MPEHVKQLRIRVREDLDPAVSPRIEVLDEDDTVLGDLTHSVPAENGVVWTMGGPNGLGIAQISFACQRASIDTIELPGTNAPRREAKRDPEVIGTAVLKVELDTSELDEFVQRLSGSAGATR